MELLEAKNKALSYIKSAERETLKWFRSDLQVQQKADLSPVTIADQNTEELLRKKIIHDFPGHGIIGEEFGNETDSAEWVWTIDPIDGTRSFIRGLPFYAILLCLLRRQEPVMAVISFPALGETAWAAKGHGAWCGNRRIQVSSQTRIDRSLVATADYYCFREKKCLKLYGDLQRRSAMIRTYPDAFGHYLAVRGAVDVMVDPWAYVWDFAPFKILAREAGGSFANFSGNKDSIREGTAIVGNSRLVQAVRRMHLASRK